MAAEPTPTTAPALFAIWNLAPAAPSYLAASIVTSSDVPVTSMPYAKYSPFGIGLDVDCPLSPHPQHAACTALGVYPARVYQGVDDHYSGTLTDRHASETTEWRCHLQECGRPHGHTSINTMVGMCTGVEQAECSMTITDAEKKIVTTTTTIEGCEAPKMRVPLTITAGFEKAEPWHAGDYNMLEGGNGDIDKLVRVWRNVTDWALTNKQCPTGRKDLEAVGATATAAASASPATAGENGAPAKTGAPAKSAGGKTRMGAGLFAVAAMACGVLSF